MLASRSPLRLGTSTARDEMLGPVGALWSVQAESDSSAARDPNRVVRRRIRFVGRMWGGGRREEYAAAAGRGAQLAGGTTSHVVHRSPRRAPEPADHNAIVITDRASSVYLVSRAAGGRPARGVAARPAGAPGNRGRSRERASSTPRAPRRARRAPTDRARGRRPVKVRLPSAPAGC